ncbi:MAG: prolipoprotein diacylglyceryl transferase [Prevotella sp.]|nr:prolipoprotein diacylglyceryl transferase [Prevotella sp.]
MTNAEWNTVSFPSLNIEFPVYNTAFTVFGFEIKWYGLVITAGLLLAAFYCFKRMKKFGIDDDRAIDVVMVGFVGAIICARLYYVFLNWDEYKNNLMQIFSVHSGGLAIYGGLIGAVLFGAAAAKIRKVRLMPLLDLAGLGFLIGQGIGRWGNFFNHECFGGNTSLPWGMTSPKIQAQLKANMEDILASTGVTVDPSLPVHPCFLYESLWCLIGFLILHFYSKRRKFDGEVFFMYIGWYGLGRFFIEGLRTDSLMVGHLRISQLVAGLCVIVSIAAVFFMRHKIKMDGEYVFYKDTEESKRLIAETEEKYREYDEKKAASKSAKAAKAKRSEVESAEELAPEDRLTDCADEEENEQEEISDGEDN